MPELAVKFFYFNYVYLALLVAAFNLAFVYLFTLVILFFGTFCYLIHISLPCIHQPPLVPVCGYLPNIYMSAVLLCSFLCTILSSVFFLLVDTLNSLFFSTQNHTQNDTEFLF